MDDYGGRMLLTHFAWRSVLDHPAPGVQEVLHLLRPELHDIRVRPAPIWARGERSRHDLRMRCSRPEGSGDGHQVELVAHHVR